MMMKRRIYVQKNLILIVAGFFSCRLSPWLSFQPEIESCNHQSITSKENVNEFEIA